MSGLDLSKFKKVSEDGKTTTLKHPDGHQIVIAIHALTPKMREELKRLPHEKSMKKELEKLPPEPGYVPSEPKKMAQGGGVRMMADGERPESAPTQDMDPNSPAPVAEDQVGPPTEMDAAVQQEAQAQSAADAQQQQAEDQGSIEPDGSSQPPAAAPGTTPAPSQPAPAAPVQPPATPVGTALPPDQQAQFYKQQALNDAHDVGQDLANGHITPKTYASMFQEKSVLGKIGTVFGMLISGAGSGLTGQPNALMQIMNNQINNDVEAQQKNVANSQNFYSLNMQHELNKSTMLNQQADILYKQAQTTLIPAQKTQFEAQANNLRAEAENTKQTAAVTAKTNAGIQGRLAALHTLINSPAAQTPQGQQAIVMASQGVEQYISNATDALAVAKSKQNMIGNNNEPTGPAQPGQTADPEADYKNKISGLRALGANGNEMAGKMADFEESHHMPGIKGYSSLPINDADKLYYTNGKKFIESAQRLRDFTAKNANSVDLGTIKQGQALAQEVQTLYGQTVNAGVFSNSEGLINKAIPSDPTKFVPSVRVLPQLDTVINETKNRTGSYLQNKLGFSKQQYEGSLGIQSQKAPQQQSTIPEGTTSVDKKTGKPIIHTNGQWVHQ